MATRVRLDRGLLATLISFALLSPALPAAVAVAGSAAELSVSVAGETVVLSGERAWTLDKAGSLSGDTVTWTIGVTETATDPGQLRIGGELSLTNSGSLGAPLGNVVVNLQLREGKKWVTAASVVADATDGDAATSALVAPKASSEGLGTFTENGASGALAFTDPTTEAAVSLVPQLSVAPGETRRLRFSAAFDNDVLELATGMPIRAELIVSFGNAAPNRASAADLDINGNGVIDADEAHVRSVPTRLPLTVPAVTGDLTPTLTDTLDDITATGDVTFADVQISLGATSGTVTATVDGGEEGGTITNCAQLTTPDESVDLEACSTVTVAGTPTCTPGAPGCGWEAGDMLTATQIMWGDSGSSASAILSSSFASQYGSALVIGGTHTITFTSATAVFNYLPAVGPAGPLTGSSQNPLTTSSGELGGEVLALRLNVDFSAANLLSSATPLGGLRFCNFTELPALNGQTVNDFLATANNILGGGSASFGASTAAAVAHLVNGAFVDAAPSTFAQSTLVAGSCPANSGGVVTRTQAVWDATTSWFSAYSSIYASTSGIVEVGIPGTAGFSMRLTSAGAVTNYFVQAGPVGALTADLINPTTSSSGAFGGQVLALRMNVDFSAAGAIGGTVAFGSLHLCAMTDASLNDRTVSEVLGLANTLLGGGSNGYTIVALTDLATLLNNSFLDGSPSTFAVEHLVNGSCP